MEYDQVKFANERNSHQLVDSCRHMGTSHNFSHQMQALGINPVVGGPRNWYYCLQRPMIRRPTHRSFVNIEHKRPKTAVKRTRRYEEDERPTNEIIIKRQASTATKTNYIEQMRELREKLQATERKEQEDFEKKLSELKQYNNEEEQEILRSLEQQQT